MAVYRTFYPPEKEARAGVLAIHVAAQEVKETAAGDGSGRDGGTAAELSAVPGRRGCEGALGVSGGRVEREAAVIVHRILKVQLLYDGVEWRKKDSRHHKYTGYSRYSVMWTST